MPVWDGATIKEALQDALAPGLVHVTVHGLSDAVMLLHVNDPLTTLVGPGQKFEVAPEVAEQFVAPEELKLNVALPPEAIEVGESEQFTTGVG